MLAFTLYALIGALLARLSSFLYLTLPPTIDPDIPREIDLSKAGLSQRLSAFLKPCIALRKDVVGIEIGVFILLMGVLHWPSLPISQSLAMLVAFALFTVATIDLKYMLLPDLITKPLVVTGVLGSVLSTEVTILSSLLGAFTGYAVLFSVNKAFFMLKGVHGIGQGDFKLFAGVGAVFGVLALLPVLLLASIIGSVVGVFVHILGNSEQKEFPFGPAISLAALVYLFMSEYALKIAYGIS